MDSNTQRSADLLNILVNQARTIAIGTTASAANPGQPITVTLDGIGNVTGLCGNPVVPGDVSGFLCNDGTWIILGAHSKRNTQTRRTIRRAREPAETVQYKFNFVYTHGNEVGAEHGDEIWLGGATRGRKIFAPVNLDAIVVEWATSKFYYGAIASPDRNPIVTFLFSPGGLSKPCSIYFKGRMDKEITNTHLYMAYSYDPTTWIAPLITPVMLPELSDYPPGTSMEYPTAWDAITRPTPFWVPIQGNPFAVVGTQPPYSNSYSASGQPVSLLITPAGVEKRFGTASYSKTVIATSIHDYYESETMQAAGESFVAPWITRPYTYSETNLIQGNEGGGSTDQRTEITSTVPILIDSNSSRCIACEIHKLRVYNRTGDTYTSSNVKTAKFSLFKDGQWFDINQKHSLSINNYYISTPPQIGITTIALPVVISQDDELNAAITGLPIVQVVKDEDGSFIRGFGTIAGYTRENSTYDPSTPKWLYRTFTVNITALDRVDFDSSYSTDVGTTLYSRQGSIYEVLSAAYWDDVLSLVPEGLSPQLGFGYGDAYRMSGEVFGVENLRLWKDRIYLASTYQEKLLERGYHYADYWDMILNEETGKFDFIKCGQPLKGMKLGLNDIRLDYTNTPDGLLSSVYIV